MNPKNYLQNLPMNPPDYRLPSPSRGAYAPADSTQPGGYPTVERIIQRGYLTIPSADPITASIDDRRDVARLGLGDLIGQVRNRYEIYRRHVEEIEQARMQVSTQAHSWLDPPWLRPSAETRDRLEELYSQQRRERLSLWKDLSGLRQSLPQWARDYLAAYRRSKLFHDGGDLE